jgi:hydroxypyruvate reductase
MNRPAPRFDDHRAHLAAQRSAALQAANPAAAVRQYLQPADFATAEKVYLVGAGKAGVAMTEAAAELLGDRLAVGVVAVPQVPDRAPERVTYVQGGHPRPTTGSLAAGRAVEALLSLVTARDLVIALISGGGSALLELPRVGLSLADLQQAAALLLESGATIQEVNLVRTRLSQLKGGGVARLAHPARLLGLILSDVVGNPLASIASGPTVLAVPDADAPLTVVDRYGLRDKLPPAALQAMLHGTGRLPGDSSRVENRLIGSNRLAAEAAAAAARQLGFVAQVVADDWQGEARVVGRRFARLVSAPSSPAPADPASTPFDLPTEPAPRCFVVGGESTVTVRGPGEGGRNQEAALAAALAIEGMAQVAIGTFATDGIDGPTDAAGAVVTGDTVPHARARGLDPERYLDENDSYHFFQAAGGLVITGPTGTNVNDLMFGLAY